LHLSEERYRELFENANDMVFTTDLSGRITSINRAGERLSGYSHEEALELDLKVMLPQAAAEGAILGLNDLRRREVEMVSRDGRHPARDQHAADPRAGIRSACRASRATSPTANAESALRHLNNHPSRTRRSASRAALHDEAGQLLATVYARVAEISGELAPPSAAGWKSCGPCSIRWTIQLRRLAYGAPDDPGRPRACARMPVSRRRCVAPSSRAHRREGLDRRGACIPTSRPRSIASPRRRSPASASARARSATVEFERGGPHLRGSIRDDGMGFDVNGVLSRVGPQGLGLMGMRERVVALGGRLSVHSTPGQGTSVEFEVPLEP
jgi:hypothetical protein